MNGDVAFNLDVDVLNAIDDVVEAIFTFPILDHRFDVCLGIKQRTQKRTQPSILTDPLQGRDTECACRHHHTRC